MSNKSGHDKFINMAQVGQFTRNAALNFEKNLVNETNYLEKVKSHEK